MGRLFWKIVIWFWLAMILTNLVAILIVTQLFWVPVRSSQDDLVINSQSLMKAVVSVLERSNTSDAKDLLDGFIGSSLYTIYVVNSQGQDIFGHLRPKALPSTLLPIKQYKSSSNTMKRIVHSAEGERYTIIIERPADSLVLAREQQRMLFDRNPRLLIARFGAAFLFGGLVCAWLAWYLTKPVRQLRTASRRLANGDLNVRVGELIGKRRDEIADLGRDFDYMAEHLQVMINGQKQLLQNISHELRSPLARINVAMALARKRDHDDVKRELDRIELEANRLECLIAQLLTLSKLQEKKVNELEEYIDIADLLKTIVTDAEYEAKNKNCHVSLECKTNSIIKANGELLYSALENIIRNAVKYTASASTVRVVLLQNTDNDGIDISICDQGPGVPEEFLSSLFEPFVRVANSRDRDSGGYGLGLAITRHAIVLHGGNVLARNREDGGLCVEVELPLHT